MGTQHAVKFHGYKRDVFDEFSAGSIPRPFPPIQPFDRGASYCLILRLVNNTVVSPKRKKITRLLKCLWAAGMGGMMKFVSRDNVHALSLQHTLPLQFSTNYLPAGATLWILYEANPLLLESDKGFLVDLIASYDLLSGIVISRILLYFFQFLNFSFYELSLLNAFHGAHSRIWIAIVDGFQVAHKLSTNRCVFLRTIFYKTMKTAGASPAMSIFN